MTSSAFQASFIDVKNALIVNNTFENTVICSYNQLINSQEYKFDFYNIAVYNNTFISNTNYLFFSSAFVKKNIFISEISFQNITFDSNRLQNSQDSDISQISFIATYKTQIIQFNNVVIKNQNKIKLSQIEYAQKVNLTQIKCINSDEFYLNNKIEDSSQCLSFSEIQDCKINDIIINNKKAIDSSLLQFENYVFSNGILEITNGVFTNIFLEQKQIDSYSNPITIISKTNFKISISDCQFSNNILKSLSFPLYYSSTALWILCNSGNIKIKSSRFSNSYANSKYSYVFASIQQINLIQVIFEGISSISDQQKSELSQLVQYFGGFMYLNVKVLSISNSTFKYSIARFGGFIYITPIDLTLRIDIMDSIFTQGYALKDGGALFISLQRSKLQLSCNKCSFENIFTLEENSSSISLDYTSLQDTQDLHLINISEGMIKNIFGNNENQFIKVIQTQIQFQDISKIFNEEIKLQTQFQNNFNKYAKTMQGTLVSLEKSELTINNCTISDYNVYVSTKAQFIDSVDSKITLIKSIIQNSNFLSSGILIKQGFINIIQGQFLNISNKINKIQRFLDEEFTYNQTLSFLLIQNSQLQISGQSNFSNIFCQKCNGSSIQMLYSQFDISSTSITQSHAQNGGGIYILGLNGINIINSLIIANNTAEIDGGAIYVQVSKNNVILLNILNYEINQFQNNNQIFSLKVQDCKFTFNKALNGFGGGISLFSQEEENSTSQKIFISDTEIILNSAKVGGGLFQKNIHSYIEGKTSLKQNIGEIYGNEQTSQPSRIIFDSQIDNLNLLNQDQKDFLALKDIRSGGYLQLLQFQLVSEYNDIIKPFNQNSELSLSIQINPNQQNLDQYEIRGTQIVTYNFTSNSFQFNNLIIIGQPETTLTLDVKSDQIYSYDPKTRLQTKNYSFKIVLNLRKCQQGEVIETKNKLVECSICKQGTYSFNVDICKECPNGSNCLGGSNIEVKQGFWRSQYLSDQIELCKNEMSNCIGGSYGDNICKQGHIGALCEQCDIYGEYWGKNYSKSSRYSCSVCSDSQKILWVIFFMTIWALSSISFTIKNDIEKIKEKAGGQILQKYFKYKKQQQQNKLDISISQKHFNKKKSQMHESDQNLSIQKAKFDKSSIYIKILSNYIQIISSLATFNLSIPTNIFEIPLSVGQPLQKTSNSLDCFLILIKTQIPIIYLKFMISLLLPFLYLILFISFFVLNHIIRKQKKFSWHVIFTATIFLIVYVQPDLVSQMISLISCRKIGENSYILGNAAYKCYSQEHKLYAFYLIIPFLALWVIIIPGLLFIILRKQRKNLDDINIKLKYGYLYQEYNNNIYYWEFVKMFQKIIIIICLNFYSQDISVKGTLVFVVITVYGILSKIFNPYQLQSINMIDFQSTAVCAISVLLGLFIQQNPYEYFTISSFVIIVIINIWFTLKILKNIIFNIFYNNPLISKIRFVLVSKIPCLIKHIEKKQNKKIIKPQIKEMFKKIFNNYSNQNIRQRKESFHKIIQIQQKIQQSIINNKLFGGEDINITYPEIKSSLTIQSSPFVETEDNINKNKVMQKIMNKNELQSKRQTEIFEHEGQFLNYPSPKSMMSEKDEFKLI